jgi:SAM-dependent methyltransferase
MDLRGWDERYRSEARASEDFDEPPAPLLVETASHLSAGTALDLACGAGRHAIWLARHGWEVTAVDGAPSAIEMLCDRAARASLNINVEVADLETARFSLRKASWNLVCICYYLQRGLFALAREAVKPGGLLLTIVHTTENGEEPTQSRLRPGELAPYFEGWEILHHYEGKSRDAAHRRPVAEIVARRPPA